MKIRWVACGKEHRDRLGLGEPSEGLLVELRWTNAGYVVFFGGEEMGRFENANPVYALGCARRFVEANIETWLSR